jgi:hypothetical protein
MGDHVVSHHPTMPGVGKTAQAVVATGGLEDGLHDSILHVTILHANSFRRFACEDWSNRMHWSSLDYRYPPRDPALLYAALYAGEIVRYSGLPEMAAVITNTRTFVEERLAYPPIEIHRYVEHEELAPRLAAIQRDYARSSEMKKLWRGLFEAAGLDLEDTARDRLVLRFQVHSDAGTTLPWARSTATVGFHRDTWGTNIPAQVNWWAPVWPITEGRTFAIHPAMWNVHIDNNSAQFDLADVMQRLRTAPGTLGPGQLAPRPLRPLDAEDGVPVVIEPGEIIAFSSAHAHVGVPNHTGLTRVSLETRTVSIADVRAGRGAPNVDGRGRWAAPGMFHRLSDGRALNELLGCEPLIPFGGADQKGR